MSARIQVGDRVRVTRPDPDLNFGDYGVGSTAKVVKVVGTIAGSLEVEWEAPYHNDPRRDAQRVRVLYFTEVEKIEDDARALSPGVLAALTEALAKVRDHFFPADQPERDRDIDWDLVNDALAFAQGAISANPYQQIANLHAVLARVHRTLKRREDAEYHEGMAAIFQRRAESA